MGGCACGDGGIWAIAVPSSKFRSETKAALKKKSWKEGKKGRFHNP